MTLAHFLPEQRLPLLAWSLVAGLPLVAQQPGLPDLQKLFETKVEIATRRSEKVDEAPSVVSVVTREEIERFGWRELADILRALPGYDFGNDGTRLMGLAERGIWAHEGKALVMVNGLTLSPLHNGNINYYGYMPSELIERVEVIRGPGSAVYGQFAGVTVINVIPRRSLDGDGGRFVLRGTTLGRGDHGGGGYLSASGHFGDGVAIAISAGTQANPSSVRPYTDTLLTGKSWPQDKGNTRVEASYVSGEVEARGFRIHFLRNTFVGAQVDFGGQGPRDPVLPDLQWGTLGTGSRIVQGVRGGKVFALGRQFSLDATLEELQNTGGAIFPQSKVSSGVNHSGTERSRFTADLGLKWTPDFPAVFLVGGGFIHNWERSVDLQGKGAMRSPEDPNQRLTQMTMQARYGYFQYSHNLAPFGLTLGARYQDDFLGSAFAPRLGLTYVEGPFNAKLLYGKAFRAPTIFQTYSTFFAFRGYLKPELIQSAELELGWKFSAGIQAKVNLYKIDVTEAISSALDNYAYYIINSGSSHSRGVEVSLEMKRNGWGGFANLSYTEPTGKSDPFFLSADREKFLGLTPLKINVGAWFKAGPVEVAPSLLWAASRQTQTARSAQSGIPPTTLLPNLVETEASPARLLLNVNAIWRGLLGRDTEARLGIQNLGNAEFPVLQPYYGAHAPLPAHDRRLTFDLVWRF